MDIAAKHNYFCDLYGDVQGWISIWGGRTHETAWFMYSEQAPEALEKALLLAEHEDVYFGVGLRRKKLVADKRGEAKDVSVLTCFYADIDVFSKNKPDKNALPLTTDAAIEFLHNLPLPPSFFITSGSGGVHAYWLFTNAIYVDAVGLEKVKASAKAWNDAINQVASMFGWKFDSVGDLARVLRVPGTLNHKNGNAAPVGVPKGDWRRYTDVEIADAQAAMVMKMPTPVDGGKIVEGERNATLTSRAGYLRHNGMNEAGIEAALQAINLAECDPPLDKAEVSNISHSVSNFEASTDWLSQQKDFGHAQALSTLFLGQYRWATHRGSWMKYNGKVWVPISEAQMAINSSILLRAYYAAELAKTVNKADIKHLMGKIIETCIYARIIGALSFLKGWQGFTTLPEEWDKDPRALNVLNGTLDLETQTLRLHNPADLQTKLARVTFDPEALGPAWASHLDMFLPNANIRRHVQRSLGMALVGATLDEMLNIWFGGGANGKSTTCRVLMELLGNYAIRAAPDLLITSKYERHPTEIADLCNSRLVFSVEVDQGKKLAESLVKELTGGDRKKARFMRQDFFEFEQTFSITMIVNHRPVIKGVDQGIWRRIKLVPWTKAVDPQLKKPQEVIVPELVAEGSAILNWLLAGLKDWQCDHLWEAPEVRAATEEYRNAEDITQRFFDDCCEIGQHYTVTVSELYDAFAEWCLSGDDEALTKTMFGKTLKARGLSQSTTGKDRIWHGLRLFDPLS